MTAAASWKREWAPHMTTGRTEAEVELRTGGGDDDGCRSPPLTLLCSLGRGSKACGRAEGWKRRHHSFEGRKAAESSFGRGEAGRMSPELAHTSSQNRLPSLNPRV